MSAMFEEIAAAAGWTDAEQVAPAARLLGSPAAMSGDAAGQNCRWTWICVK